MAKGDYYFPLYYKRLLTSTIGWSDSEFGCYVRLLIYQFDNGSIPNDLEELARIAPTVKKHWKLLSKKFKPDDHGGLVNEVMVDVRIEANKRADRARENGRSGGRPKKPKSNPEETHSDISGLQNQNPDESYPITNNQEPILERDPIEEREPAPDFKNSNLFRKPVVPTKQQVWEIFSNAGGTKEMAKSFYEKHEGTGWFINGSPIVSVSALAQRFITNWKENEKKNNKPGQELPSGPPLKRLN